ncbi:MAG TPA: hypothetical protein VHE12_05850 [bacterium]|nr:hypothetical protein [bacterium]
MSLPTQILHVTLLRLLRGACAAWEKWLIAEGVSTDLIRSGGK